MEPKDTMLTTSQIEEWLVGELAKITKTAPQEINREENFSNYGLSSLKIALLKADLEELLNRDISIYSFWDYPTIRQLANYLTRH